MKRILSILVAIGFLCISISAQASTITFIHEGSGSGTIDGTPFDASFTITAIGDTSSRGSFGFGFWIDHTSAIIDIDSVGSFSFITGTRTFVAQGADATVGFSRAGIFGLDLFNGPTDDAAFSTWDMLTSIGPVSGSGDLSQWSSSDVMTDGGTLFFDTQDTDVRFTASVGGQNPIPEPGTLLLFGVGLLGLARMNRRTSSESD